MQHLTIQDLKSQKLLLFECISGSRAYGTNLPSSDTDIKGVFILPKSDFYGLDYTPQVNDAKSDQVYYEIGRFAELLTKSNPNILEMLATPPDCILYCHPLFEPFLKENFLSKQCKETFAGFAFAQVKKARGLNKKINKPMPPERKTPLDFCYIAVKQGAMPVQKWLEKQGWQQEDCGLVVISNMRDLYGLFHDPTEKMGFSGIIRKETANEVALSSVPKGTEPVALLSFNKDAYSMHCRDYKEYQEWLDNRNEERYENTIAHGKNYDAKNMMHTIRLLETALDILEHGVLQVRRPNREQLLEIRKGGYEYDALMALAEEKLARIDVAFASSTLPELPNRAQIEQLLVEIREKWY